MILHFHSQDADDAQFAEAVCRSPDIQLQRHPSIESALKAYGADTAAGHSNSVLIGVTTKSEAEQLRAASDSQDANRIHVIAPPSDIELLDVLFSARLLGNFIVRRFKDHIESGDHYARIIRSCDPSVTGGVDLVMGSDQMLAMDLVSQADKADAERVVIAELERLGLGNRVATLVASALDEMLLNATIDAPRERAAEGTDTGFDARVQVQLATSGEFVGINVVDYAGSLDRSAVFHHIAKSFRTQSLSDLDPNATTAGLGLALIFKTGASVRFMCKQGQKTEVGLFFKRLHKIMEFRSQFQFVSTQFWQ